MATHAARAAIRNALEDNGVLGELRAALRAAVVRVVTDGDAPSRRVSQLLQHEDARQALSLVSELLGAFGLASTRSVLHTELGVVGSDAAPSALLPLPEAVALSLGLPPAPPRVAAAAAAHPSFDVIPTLRTVRGASAPTRVPPPAVVDAPLSAPPPCLLLTLVQLAHQRGGGGLDGGSGGGGGGGVSGGGGGGGSGSSVGAGGSDASLEAPVWHHAEVGSPDNGSGGRGGVGSWRTEGGSRWSAPPSPSSQQAQGQPAQAQRRGVYSGGDAPAAPGAGDVPMGSMAPAAAAKGGLGRSISATLGLLGGELMRDLAMQQQQPATPPSPPPRAPRGGLGTRRGGDEEQRYAAGTGGGDEEEDGAEGPFAGARVLVDGGALRSAGSSPASSPSSPALVAGGFFAQAAAAKGADLGATVRLGRGRGALGSLAEQAQLASSDETDEEGAAAHGSAAEASPRPAAAPPAGGSPLLGAWEGGGVLSPSGYSDAFDDEEHSGSADAF